MNTLTLGFLYTVGMGWALCECCIVAGTGNWLPLIGFLTIFMVFFAVVGCLDVSDGATNTLGSAVMLILGVTMLVFAFDAWTIGTGVFLLKLCGAVILFAASVLSLIAGTKKSSHQHG